MPKWLSRCLHLRVGTYIFIVLCFIALIQFFACYGVYHYKHIPREQLKDRVFRERNPRLPENKQAPNCDYEHLLDSDTTISIKDIPKKYDEFSANGIVNGSYVPGDCNPLFSVAVLVTYRNRQSQLDVFLPYVHDFLRKQKIHYKIYLIEQADENLWNKGLLYNIGARQAQADGFPCLILHDVDLLPLDEGNLYACLEQPRHVSASIDKFRFVLPYDTLVGGVLAMRTLQYMAVNGFSNRFQGWGGEDDDFAARIAKQKLDIWRYPPYLSRYTMLVHQQEQKNSQRHRVMHENLYSHQADGVTTIKYQDLNVKNHRLFTMIRVKL